MNFSFLFNVKRNKKRPTPRRTTARLRFETLESRTMKSADSVAWHGGQVISHVEVDTVYYGQAWNQVASSTTGPANIAQTDQYFATLTSSSYMSMLGEYGIGQGHFGKHDIVNDSSTPIAGKQVLESQIQNLLQTEVQAGRLPPPNGNQVYFVYLPPSVNSRFDTDQQFLAHHNSFQMQVFAGYSLLYNSVLRTSIAVPYYRTQTVAYAVIPYQGFGGYLGTDLATLTPFDQMTEVASHELTEAVTNPYIAVSQAQAFSPIPRTTRYVYSLTAWGGGWYSDTTGNEIGDIANQQYGYFDGYVVQREWSNFYQGNILPLFDTSYLGQNPNLYTFLSQTGTFNGHTLITEFNYYSEWQIGPNDYSGWLVAGQISIA